MKFPNIICTTVIAFLVMIVVLKSHKLKHAILASTLWLFNPFTILMTSMWVSLDIVSIMFLVLGVLLLMKKRYSLGGLAMAFSATIRPFSLIALPFMFIIVEKTKRKNFLFLVHLRNRDLLDVLFIRSYVCSSRYFSFQFT